MSSCNQASTTTTSNQNKEDDQNSFILVKFVGIDSPLDRTMHVQCRKTTLFGKIKKCYMDLYPNHYLQFTFNGTRVLDDDTPYSLDMTNSEDNNVIEVWEIKDYAKMRKRKLEKEKLAKAKATAESMKLVLLNANKEFFV